MLSVETRELGINAGLQDRVIQAYGGLVYMDFSKEHMHRGYGEYEALDMTKVRDGSKCGGVVVQGAKGQQGVLVDANGAVSNAG